MISISTLVSVVSRRCF